VGNDERAADFKAVLADPPDAAAVARLSQSPGTNAQLRTTCIATLVSGGHAQNAIPQTATATVNCRIVPGETPAEVQQTLTKVIDDPDVKITTSMPGVISPASPLHPAILGSLKEVVDSMWPGTQIMAVMAAGATDGKYLRNVGIPAYGINGTFGEAGESRAHGRDERTNVRAFEEGLDFMYRLMRNLGQKEKP
jgi:acetylornithine deacetylase/succinyl-diaminopimelate desuccinylase-like protein